MLTKGKLITSNTLSSKTPFMDIIAKGELEWGIPIIFQMKENGTIRILLKQTLSLKF